MKAFNALVIFLWASCSLETSFALTLPQAGSLPFSINFEHDKIKTEHTVFLEYNKKASFHSKDGIYFEVTPRRLYTSTVEEARQTVLLEMVIHDTNAAQPSIVAAPTISLERGGSATIDNSKRKLPSQKPYKLSVMSLR